MTESRANVLFQERIGCAGGHNKMWEHCSEEGAGSFEAAKEYLSLLSAPCDHVLRFSQGQSQCPCPASLPAPEES